MSNLLQPPAFLIPNDSEWSNDHQWSNVQGRTQACPSIQDVYVLCVVLQAREECTFLLEAIAFTRPSDTYLRWILYIFGSFYVFSFANHGIPGLFPLFSAVDLFVIFLGFWVMLSCDGQAEPSSCKMPKSWSVFGWTIMIPNDFGMLPLTFGKGRSLQLNSETCPAKHDWWIYSSDVVYLQQPNKDRKANYNYNFITIVQ